MGRITTEGQPDFHSESRVDPNLQALQQRLAILEAEQGLAPTMPPADPAVSVSIQQNVQGLDLPSKCFFYGKVKSISVRDILYRELMLISTHQQSQSFRSLAEAISNTVLNYSGMRLSFGDWQYILYHHRMLLERKWELRWDCQDENHIAATQQLDNPMPTSSLQNVVTVKNTTFEYVHPDFDKVRSLRSERGELLLDGEPVVNNQGVRLFVGPFTVSDMADMIDDDASVVEGSRMAGMFDADALAMLRSQNALASYISKTPDNETPTLAGKRAFLTTWFDNAPANHKFQSSVMQAIFQFGEACKHGVNEFAKVKCEACGCETVRKIVVNPADFFPEIPA